MGAEGAGVTSRPHQEPHGAVDFHLREAAAHKAIADALENGTYEALMAHESAWVPVEWVATTLAITMQAANNRLKHLVEVGVCRRRRLQPPPRGGRRYEYHWLARVGAL